jgi:hypothetical protein
MKHLSIVVLFMLFIMPNILPAQDDGIIEKIQSAGGKDDYPGANLLVIFDSTKVNVKESGLSYVNFHRLYKILTPKGALSKRIVKIGYDPLSAYVEIREVRIYRKDGQIETLDLKNVQDYPAPARGIYWGAREKMIEIGRLEPGDAIEVKLFRKGFTYALLTGEDEDERYIPPMRGHYYDIIEFWSSDPVKEKVYRVYMPNDKPLQYEFYNGEARSSIHFKDDKTVYTFTKTDIQPFKRETDMAATSDEAPKLLLSTSPDWYAKSKWFYGVNEDYGSFEFTPEIKQKVDEILKGAKTEYEKISRLTHWAADEIRYSGLNMGPGEGYTLHKGEMIFRDRSGVCKDKAGMLITMLRAAGFESYAAMTMAGSRIDYIPADQFNHSVTIVKLADGKYHLLDPTWVPFVRELWSSAEQQQQYLMGPPEGSDLATTPLSPPENHYYRISGNSEIQSDETLKGKFTLEAEGQTDAMIRRVFIRQFKSLWLPSIEMALLQSFPLMEIQHVDYGDPYDYSNPIKIIIKFRIPNFAVITDNEIIFTPLVASNIFNHRYFNRHFFVNTDLEERKYTFRTRCSKLIELKEKIKLPKYKKAVYIPQVETVKGSGADFSGGYNLKGRTLNLTEKIAFKKRIYEPDDWQSYRQAILAQKKLAEEKIILKR